MPWPQIVQTCSEMVAHLGPCSVSVGLPSPSSLSAAAEAGEGPVLRQDPAGWLEPAPRWRAGSYCHPELTSVKTRLLIYTAKLNYSVILTFAGMLSRIAYLWPGGRFLGMGIRIVRLCPAPFPELWAFSSALAMSVWCASFRAFASFGSRACHEPRYCHNNASILTTLRC